MVISNHCYAGLKWKSTNGAERESYKTQFEEKNSVRKFNVTAKACAERNTEIKERPYFQCNKGKDDLKARSNTAELPTYERKRLKESSAPRKKQQTRAHMI